MSNPTNRQDPWAVLLAGGDGARLQTLTRRISGDSRPKQFCCLFGGKTLLTQTRERIRPLFQQDRTMFVVNRAHDIFYREDLPDIGKSRMVVQPRNRGTAVAIGASLLRIVQAEAGALVVFFPCDHYYSNDDAFGTIVGSAIACAKDHPESIVLLGAGAHYPEVEYGWIETGRPIPNSPLFQVNRFWEKPSVTKARSLWRRGCLWNTFITIGRAATFLELLHVRLPHVMECLAANDLDSAYAQLDPVDFSTEVLSPMARRLLVVQDTESGWADLGNPNRVIDTLVRNHIQPAWLHGVTRPAQP
jgi:mannose-1-phosphate guanylyltransferase